MTSTSLRLLTALLLTACGTLIAPGCSGSDTAANGTSDQGDAGGGPANTGDATTDDDGGSATPDTGPAGECSVDADCTPKLPQTTPPNCAEAKCDALAHKCHFVAKDADGDGHTAKSCSGATATIETGDDCDDGDPTTYPGAWDGPATDFDSGPGAEPNRCDNKDNDCNANVDDGKLPSGDGGQRSCACDPAKPPSCYEYSNGIPVDPSGATLGADNKPRGTCKLGSRLCPAGVPGACNGAVGPSAELCDDLDHNCDGVTGNQGDPSVTIKPTWYKDLDGDGFGDASTPPKVQCASPGQGWTQTVTGNTDCNDNDPTVNPGHPEVCDGKDNNCNGTIDEGGVLKHYCTDADSDTYCTATCADACAAPAHMILSGSCAAGVIDCNDSNQNVHPGAAEVCNGVDDNCNGTVDEGVTHNFCKDSDNDSHCTSACVAACPLPAVANPPPAGYKDATNNACLGTVGDDCNDANAAIYTGHAEVCDGLDNNCNGTIDEGVTTHYCQDADNDNYCTTTCTDACSPPSGYRTSTSCLGTDCNDTTSAMNPGNTELCNGIDDNCSGTIDEGFNIGAACQAGTPAYGTCLEHGTVVCKTTTSSGCTVSGNSPGGWSTSPSTDTNLVGYPDYNVVWDWNCNGRVDPPLNLVVSGASYCTTPSTVCDKVKAQRGAGNCGTGPSGHYYLAMCTPTLSICGQTAVEVYCNDDCSFSFSNSNQKVSCE